MARKRETTARHRIEYGLARALQSLICAMPLSAAREFGADLGSIAYSLGIRREVSLGHLRRIFGDRLTEEQLERIARESYRNFGRMTFEYGRFPRLDRRLIERTVTLSGAEHLDAALAAGGGALLIAGHFGNWEMAATIATMGYPLTFLVGEQHNRLVDGLMNRLRQGLGVETVPLTGSLLGVFRALRNNRIVAMLSDQDAGKSGVFVDFLGLPASTPYGPGRLAWKTGAPLLPGMAVRRGTDRHELVICPPVQPPPAGTPESEAVRHYTQGYTSVLEEYVRKYPEQYFWMHKRWKTRPEQASSRSA